METPSVSKTLTLLAGNPLLARDTAPQILFKFQYFCGNFETLKWFQENFTTEDHLARLQAVTEAERIKNSSADDERLAYLVKENLLFEAVRIVKENNPNITMAELLRKITLPKLALPEYNHENYVAMLCRYWGVSDEQTTNLTWTDFPSNGEEDLNVFVPYRLNINTFLLYESKILLESLGAWYGQNFNSLPFEEFMCRLNWYLRYALHQFEKEKSNNNEFSLNVLTKELAEVVSQVLNSPDTALKDVLNAASFLIDEGRCREVFELHLDVSLIEFYRKILDSHINLCPTIFGIFIVMNLFLSGNVVLEAIASDKALATLCVWSIRKMWTRSSTFRQRHAVKEFAKLKQLLPVFIKDRFSLNRLLSLPATDLANRFHKMELMFQKDNIPLYVLANYVPWIFINDKAFTYPNVPVEYLPLAAFIHIRHLLNKVSNATNPNQNQNKYKTNAHTTIQCIIKVLSIRNLVEPIELLELANAIVDFQNMETS